MGDLILVLSGALDSQETEWNKWKFTLLKKKTYNTCVGVFLFTQSVIGHLVNNQVHVGEKNRNIHYKTCLDMAICKHSLDFFVLHLYPSVPALALMWSRYRVSTFSVLGGEGVVALFIKEYNMHKLACIHARTESHCQKYLDPLRFLGEPIPKQVVSKVKWKTTPYCADKGTAQCTYAVEK